ncbi:unnamed protein product [Rhizoctonia solani]|uniref:Uncharacterized protein n=1 Tax=Rhizoctonia solani TaxID=456999 RepID=A0A8H3C829_9AGAM|nr:unnamed protein product [Rhizoctonia solani]
MQRKRWPQAGAFCPLYIRPPAVATIPHQFASLPSLPAHIYRTAYLNMYTPAYLTQADFPQADFPQADFTQAAFTPEVLDFSFMDSQPLALNTFSDTSFLNNSEFLNIPNVELDEQLMNMCLNLTSEEIQQMIDTFPTSPTTHHQATQSVPLEAAYFQQEVPPQVYESATNVLPQPPMIVPSHTTVVSQPAAAPEQPEPAPVASSSKTPFETRLLKAITLLKLNIRFNPLFQKMGIISCPDKIDLKAGMEREDAMIAAGYLPQTHISWEQALKLLGKQGFRTYYYSEMKKARASNIELPPVPEWITRYCFAKGAGKKPAGPNKKSSAENSLKNKQMVAKVMLARNNPTRKSKAAATLQKNKGKGKAVDTQRYNPYARQ